MLKIPCSIKKKRIFPKNCLIKFISVVSNMCARLKVKKNIIKQKLI